MDSLFLFNDSGCFLLEKHYRGQVGRAACEPLLQQLQQHGPKALLKAPRIMRSSDNCILLHIHRDKLLLAAACTTEAEPLLMLEMLQQLYELLCRYCCDGAPLTEEALRSNFSAVYVLADLAVDFGYPFIMEENLVQLLLQPSSVVAKAMQLVHGSSRMLTSLAASIGLRGQQQQQQQQQHGSLAAAPDMTPGAGLGTGSGKGEGSGLSGSGSDYWWRRGAVTYASNEVYVDLIEKISGVVDSSGKMLNSSVTGKVMMNSRLSGIPELCLSVRQPELLQRAAFHPCVRIQRLKRDGVLALCPPDREFCVATYWLRDKSFALPVSVSGCVSFPRNSGGAAAAAPSAPAEASSGRLTLKLTAHNPRGIASAGSNTGGGAENISVQIPLPSFVGAASITASSGTIRFIPAKQLILWEVPALAFDSPTQTAEGTVSLVPDEAQRSDAIPPHETRLVAQVNFLVKNWVPSGLKLESLDVSGVAAQPYKGCRCGTVAGELEFRLSN